MDLYRIFVTHNRPWSKFEIFLFVILFLCVAGLALFLVKHGRIAVSQAIAGILLFVFLGIVFGSTVFTRESDGVRNFELKLFWSWKLALQGNMAMLEEIVLNVILLFPVGLLLPALFHKRLGWWKGLLIGIFISAVIELCQLIFCRGLFEWDDMVHNGIGCMLGSLIGNVSEVRGDT